MDTYCCSQSVNEQQHVMSLPMELGTVSASYLGNSDFGSMCKTCSGFNKALQTQFPIRMINYIEHRMLKMHTVLQSIAFDILLNYSHDKMSLNAWRGCVGRIYNEHIAATVNLWLIDVIGTYQLFKTSYWIPENTHSYHQIMTTFYEYLRQSPFIPQLTSIKEQITGSKWKLFENAFPLSFKTMHVIKLQREDQDSFFNFVIKYHYSLWQQMDFKINSLYLCKMNETEFSAQSIKHFKATKQYIHDLWFNILESLYYRFYDLLLGNWQNLIFEDNDRIFLFFEILNYAADSNQEQMYDDALKIVIAIKKSLSDDNALMMQMKNLFDHFSDFLGLIGDNRRLWCVYKERAIKCVEMSDVLLAIDKFLSTLKNIYFARVRNENEYWIGHMMYQQMYFVRSVIEEFCVDMANNPNFENIKKIAMILTHITVVIDVLHCIPNIHYFDPLEHRTKSMALITKSYLMYNVLNGSWFP